MGSETSSATGSAPDGELEFRSFRDLDVLEASERQAMVGIYESLFAGFHLDLAEVQEMVSHPRALNVMILRASPAGARIIGFYSGLPLRDVEWIPGGLRYVVRWMMPRAFFLAALGLESSDSGLSLRNLVRTYQDCGRRILDLGYRTVYTLAREQRTENPGAARSSRQGGGIGLAQHLLQRFGGRRIWKTVELVPGERFVPIRIARIERSVRRFGRLLHHEAN